MRYNLESTLPINAFSPRGGRGPFSYGMTLEGGNPIAAITDPISSVLGTDGGGGGILGAVEDIGQGIGGALEDVGQSIGGALASVDNFVGDTIPGGWSTVAAVAIPYAAPYAIAGTTGATLAASQLTAAQAAALSAGTSAATGAIRGDKLEDILKNAAISGATSYGLSSLGGAGENIDLNTPYIDTPDGINLLTPGSASTSLDDALRAVADDIPNAASNLAANADDLYNDQFIRAFENPQISEFQAFEPTASITSSDIPSPDLVSRGASSFTPEQLDDIARGQGVFPEGSAALPGSSLSTASPFVQQNYGVGPYTADQLNEIARAQGVFPEGSAALPKGQLSLYDRIASAPGQAYDYLTNPENTISKMGGDLYDSVMANKLEYGLGALGVAGLMGQGPLSGLGNLIGTAPKSSSSTSRQSESSSVRPGINPRTGRPYTYGIAGEIDPNYMLRNRINAQNVYSPATGYQPVSASYASGGEVKNFALGGLAKSLTNVFQPIEKAVVRPIGEAVPFLKDAMPYAGLAAAPFIASPMAAAGVGALASGMGKGGFNLRRALMGGISAYGLSNMGSGLAEAGAPGEGASGFFNKPESMTKGLENLTSSGNTYKTAATNFATKAGLPSAGMAIMGGTGIGAVNEGIDQQAASDQALAQSEAAQNEKNAKIQAARDRAFSAIRSNPYQYAIGGSVDDESGMDEARGMMQGNLQKGMFGMGYATGGQPRFLSGGGDGMSDSIKANINGTQEARLADGEFVIPADVVSGLGNGSSKAGAKQLYTMMDRVRQARTGTKTQGKQINPRKLMAA